MRKKTLPESRIFRKVLCLLTAAGLVLGGCGSDEGNDSTGEGSSSDAGASGSSVAGEPAGDGNSSGEEEWVDLNIIAVAGNYASIENAVGSPVYEKIQEDTKVNLTVTPMDADKWNVTMSGGDTTDIIVFHLSQYIKPMVESELVIPLDELISQYGPNVSARSPESLEYAAEISGDGKIYCLPYGEGLEGGNSKATNSALLTRWDLYKQIGAPELTSMQDYAEALAEMVALEPVTEGGLPVYGVALYTAENSFTSLIQYARCMGFEQFNDWIATRIKDGTMSYAYTDEDSSFWQALEFCQKAYELGILDPDSFTQKLDDYQAKEDNGQILTPVWRDHVKDLQQRWMEAGSQKGYAILPMEGTFIAENKNSVCGAAFGFAIASTCKNPQRAMQLIDYLCKPETSRMIYSGMEGEDWEIVDGVPVPTQEAIELKNAGGDAFNATGINNAALYGMAGLARGVMMEDGAVTDLYRSEGFHPMNVNSVDLDFCAFYGDYAYPNQVLLDKGTSDLSGLNMRIASGYGQAPEDIQRIDARLLELALRSVPGIIMTDSREDFEKAKEEAIAAFREAGAEESRAWWQGRWDELNAKYGK